MKPYLVAAVVVALVAAAIGTAPTAQAVDVCVDELTSLVRVCIYDYHDPVPVGFTVQDSTDSVSTRVYEYSFDLSTGGKLRGACPVVFRNTIATDPCRTAGGVRGQPLTDPVVVYLKQVASAVDGYLVEAFFDATVGGFGVTGVPVTVFCSLPDCSETPPDPCHMFMVERFWSEVVKYNTVRDPNLEDCDLHAIW